MARKSGILGTLRRNAREIFEGEDEIPLPGSRLRCLIFLSP